MLKEMNRKELKEEFEKELLIARQLDMFGDNPTAQERATAESRLKEIAREYKEKKR